MTGQWSRETKKQYSKVSQGNKETYRKEKMAKELGSKGFNNSKSYSLYYYRQRWTRVIG